MITQAAVSFQPPSQSAWQKALAEAISSPLELLQLLEIDPAVAGFRLSADIRFRQRVPRGFAARMRKGDPLDPLLLQVLPLAEEDAEIPGFLVDPVGDLKAETVPGMLHKYHGRALIVITGACAIHCRYCFRRHFPYGDSNPSADHWRRVLEYLRGDGSITEVILSGGDPLSLPDARLADLAQALAEIPHLKRLRVHTRLPVVLPERVVDSLLAWLVGTRLHPVMVIHANHANEIDDAVRAGLRLLRDARVPLLNQSVLLKNINDSVEALCDLNEALFEADVLPYYLHLLDPVQGSAHFNIDDAAAHRLLDAMRARLPGYLVPRLVREIAGLPYKLLFK
ncbi:MAG TPA: EF-P beta-lysylation protein EpmB [Gammaproteobacteria bacterium]|nr:EF-P beta-lysylation protein EpmB [Gammaproteobacteria bacterium]